jgi:hypothetical protein
MSRRALARIRITPMPLPFPIRLACLPICGISHLQEPVATANARS